MSDGAPILYHVRQYRPNYFEGFKIEVVHNVPYEQILDAPWFRNFKHSDFKKFSIKPYGNGELIISAHYGNGQHWVAGFAVRSDHELAADYQPQPE